MCGCHSVAAMSASRLNRWRYSLSARHVGGQHLQRVAPGQTWVLGQVDLAHAAGAQKPHDGVAREGLTSRLTAWPNSTDGLQIESEIALRRGPRDADQHHAAVALRLGQQGVAVVDGAGHHPRPARAAEALLA